MVSPTFGFFKMFQLVSFLPRTSLIFLSSFLFTCALSHSLSHARVSFISSVAVCVWSCGVTVGVAVSLLSLFTERAGSRCRRST